MPFDYTKVIESVENRKVIIVGDACGRGSIMKDMAKYQQFAFDYLDAPAVAYGSRNWITPAFGAKSITSTGGWHHRLYS